MLEEAEAQGKVPHLGSDGGVSGEKSLLEEMAEAHNVKP